MPGELREFWLNRYKEFGHTGWKDTITYAYDQIERLSIVSFRLDPLCIEPPIAIDFGCGTGDFSRLMLDKGFRVWGYDPYVKPSISHPYFTYAAKHAGMDIPSGKAGFILTVTVLDHILDDREFSGALTYLRSKISQQGVLIMIEYALDAVTSSSNEYQALRTIEMWEWYLSTHGWQISDIEPLPHPKASPSVGFMHYSQNVLVRLLGKFSRRPFLNPLLQLFLTKYAQSVLRKYGIGCVNRSPLKLMLCTPRQNVSTG